MHITRLWPILAIPAAHSQFYVESSHFPSSYPAGRRQGWDQFLPMNNVLAPVREFLSRPTHQRSFIDYGRRFASQCAAPADIYGT
jgi:hypothetical protein